MDGFTGLNINGVHEQMDELYHAAFDIALGLIEVEDIFLHDLREKWASPKAVEFSTMAQSKFMDLDKSFCDSVRHILHGVNDAGRSLAMSHDATWNDFNYMDGLSGDGEIGEICLETINGITGMAVENVKIISQSFSDSMKNILKQFSSIPKSIAFYDVDGNLMSRYGIGLDNFYDKIEGLVNSIVGELKNCIETEANNILLAKEQAVDTLRS